MLADDVTLVIGVDTHKDTHAVAVLARPTGALIDEFEIRADPAGSHQAIARVGGSSGVGAWAVEGTGSYGAGLCRALRAAGIQVIEADHPTRRERGGVRGKSDPLDAIKAARAAIAARHTATPKDQEAHAGLRALMVARDGAVMARADATRQIKALVLTAPDHVHERLRGLSGRALVTAAGALGHRHDGSVSTRRYLAAMRALARRIEALAMDARALHDEIRCDLDEKVPSLRALPGVGVVCGARILLAYSHTGRLRSEAAFARLSGTAPIPAHSGTRVRHRLDRGGDRALNSAIQTVALTRIRTDERSRAYMERRISEGKTRKEALRCLKRHIVRGIYRSLEASMKGG